MDTYDRLAETALRLLAQYGRPAVLRSPGGSGGVYNVETGRVEGLEPSEQSRHVLEIMSPSRDMRDQLGSQISQVQKFIYMDGKGRAPTQSDSVVMDGSTYGVYSVNTMRPGLTTLLYVLALKS